MSTILGPGTGVKASLSTTPTKDQQDVGGLPVNTFNRPNFGLMSTPAAPVASGSGQIFPTGRA